MSDLDLRAGLRWGLITLGIVFYLSVIGLPLTMGAAVIPTLALVVAFIAYGVLRDRGRRTSTLPEVTLNGLLLGAIAGVGFALITALVARLQTSGAPVTDLFYQLLPDHTAALTGLTKASFQAGASVTGGLLRLALFLTGGGLVGGLATRLGRGRPTAESDAPAKGNEWRRWTILALPAVFFALFALLRTQAITLAGAQENIIGLVISFAYVAAAIVAWRRARAGRETRLVAALYLGLFLLIPFLGDQFQNAVLGKVVIFALIGMGLNIVIGFTGLLDLGYVAYFALGAYTFGLLSSPSSYFVVTLPWLSGISFWVGLPLAIFTGVAGGLLLGVPLLRLRGDYLAIVTLGFAEIMRLMLLNLRDYTGGPGGVLGIPSPELFGIDFGDPRRITYLAFFALAIVTFIIVRLRDSQVGRAWLAIREDQDVAQVMGINLVRVKLLAFAIGAAFASAGGAFYAAQQVNIFPDNFRLEVSIDILSMVIIGGLGSIEGVILGSIALNGLPEVLRGVDEYRIIAFGALLMVMMILRPQGLLPPLLKQTRIEEDDRSQDAWLRMAGLGTEAAAGDDEDAGSAAGGTEE